MNSWLETLLALLISCAALAVGLRARRFRWVFMFLGIAEVAVALVAAKELPRRAHGFLLSAAVPLITVAFFSCELSRFVQFGLACATLVTTFFSGWMEFLAPALARAELADLKTKVDQNGVCRQTTDYTCGPAAAVTALRRLGFAAEEGDLALLAHCSQRTGTDPSDLAAAINERFGPAGAHAQSRPLETLADLAQAGLALTVVKFGENLDHWVVVLEVNEREVRLADPFRGLRVQPRADFEQDWEHETIRIERK